jgi:hypothetical protein
MAGDDVLRISTAVDVAAIQAGMASSASAVTSGTEEMAAGFDRVATASEAAEARIRGGMEGTAYSVTEARHALHGLGEEMGVHIPRFVQSFVANMGVVGPMLASAFSVIAVVGFVEVLEQIPAAIDAIVEKLSGWTKEEQAAWEASKKANEERRALLNQLAVETERNRSLTSAAADPQHEGIIKSAADLKAYQLELQQTTQHLKEVQQEQAGLARALEGTPVTETVMAGRGVTTQKTFTERALPQGYANWDQVKKDLAATQEEATKLANRLTELQSITIPRSHLEGEADAIKEARAELEEYNRAREQEGRELEEQAIKRGEAGQREIDEKAAFDDEIAKESLAAAQKDLEQFEKEQSDKIRIAEEAGRAQLEIIRRNAEEQERDIAKRTGKGGEGSPFAGDADTVAAARAAYSQQADLIADLIGKEEQLRVTTLDANNPADREAWNSSLQREQGLVNELQVAWQQYQKTVQTVNDQIADRSAAAIMRVTGDVNAGIIGWANRQQSFGRAMEQSWTKIGDQAISQFLRMGEQYVAMQVRNMIVQRMAETNQVTASLEAAALSKSTAMEEQLAFAKAAAAKAYSALADIPVAGPALGAAAAAGTFSFLMAFDKGGIMPQDNIAMLHKNEMVLPPDLSSFVQNAAARSSGQAPAGMTFNFSHSVSAVDAQGVGDVLRAHEALIQRAVYRSMRRGGFQ